MITCIVNQSVIGKHNTFGSPLLSPKSINVTDRATLFNLLIGLNGYTISSGVLSVDLNGDSIVSIPLSCDEEMEIGYIVESGRPRGELAKSYVEHLNRYIWENKG